MRIRLSENRSFHLCVRGLMVGIMTGVIYGLSLAIITERSETFAALPDIVSFIVRTGATTTMIVVVYFVVCERWACKGRGRHG